MDKPRNQRISKPLIRTCTSSSQRSGWSIETAVHQHRHRNSRKNPCQAQSCGACSFSITERVRLYLRECCGYEQECCESEIDDRHANNDCDVIEAVYRIREMVQRDWRSGHQGCHQRTEAHNHTRVLRCFQKKKILTCFASCPTTPSTTCVEFRRKT